MTVSLRRLPLLGGDHSYVLDKIATLDPGSLHPMSFVMCPEWAAGIQMAALDPFRGYGAALSAGLPHAVRVLDAFHVVRLGFALHAPQHAEDISRVLAIPPKRRDRPVVCFLTTAEIDALLAAADRATRLGRRDHAMLILACQTGLRVSELIGLPRADVDLGAGAHCRCTGKGRKDRATPLTRKTVAALRVWLADHDGEPHDALFTTSRGQPLSRDAVAKMITKHATRAALDCPSIVTKHVTPHTLRRGDGAAARRGRHRRHRAVARSRGSQLHPGLSARRHDHQRAGPLPRRTAEHEPRTLPPPPTLSSHSSTTSDPAGKPGLCRPTSRTHSADQPAHAAVGIIRQSA